MARKTRHRVGIRIELPTRCVSKLDLDAEYKKRFKRVEHFELCLDTGVTPEVKAGIILARAKGCEPRTSTFSVLVSLDSKQSVMRIVQILNVLGDNRVMREKLSVYMTNKSVLNQIPELLDLQAVLDNLSKIIPGLADHAWVHAPEATL
jgi:hypothetical protein